MQLSPRASYRRMTQKEYSLACGSALSGVAPKSGDRCSGRAALRQIEPGGPQNYYGRSGLEMGSLTSYDLRVGPFRIIYHILLLLFVGSFCKFIYCHMNHGSPIFGSAYHYSEKGNGPKAQNWLWKGGFSTLGNLLHTGFIKAKTSIFDSKSLTFLPAYELVATLHNNYNLVPITRFDEPCI